MICFPVSEHDSPGRVESHMLLECFKKLGKYNKSVSFLVLLSRDWV